ncbi:uncharacterized protein LOC117585039 [Drosophila guanche]|uniref:DUF7775 domain-containing protein n=1 Tax=Drosophila guanche TaxID=7266 RepID=A0A3B0KBE4_DROGU|nr:uncharacterized protein LOC117585039 [Drosophila guanche]SPP83439.1 Hypothetical predicted protein [Drosophila guanche]
MMSTFQLRPRLRRDGLTQHKSVSCRVVPCRTLSNILCEICQKECPQCPAITMRPVLFLFYTVETVVNMMLMGYHIRGFMSLDLSFLSPMDQTPYYFYTATFYIFTVLNIFSSINVCTGHKSVLLEEILRTLAGCILYMIISLMTLKDVENDFHMMYLGIGDPHMPEKPVHPFFAYLRAQAVCSLVCSIIYLLHCLIVIDVMLSYKDADYQIYDTSDDSDEDMDYIPVRLYFCGVYIQERLERYRWFRDFSNGGRINI